jgi:hypothetical protein
MDYQKELLERTKNTKFYLPILYNNLDYKTSDFSKICYICLDKNCVELSRVGEF